jgi:hypothetical protein
MDSTYLCTHLAAKRADLAVMHQKNWILQLLAGFLVQTENCWDQFQENCRFTYVTSVTKRNDDKVCLQIIYFSHKSYKFWSELIQILVFSPSLLKKKIKWWWCSSNCLAKFFETRNEETQMGYFYTSVGMDWVQCGTLWPAHNFGNSTNLTETIIHATFAVQWLLPVHSAEFKNHIFSTASLVGKAEINNYATEKLSKCCPQSQTYRDTISTKVGKATAGVQPLPISDAVAGHADLLQYQMKILTAIWLVAWTNSNQPNKQSRMGWCW